MSDSIENKNVVEVDGAIFNENSNESNEPESSEDESSSDHLKKRQKFQKPRHDEKIDYSQVGQDEIIYASYFRKKTVQDLVEIAKEMNIPNVARMIKQDIICAILKKHGENGKHIMTDGVLSVTEEGFGFLRAVENNYKNAADDCYVSIGLIKNLGLRTGDLISCFVRCPRGTEKYFACNHVVHLEGQPIHHIKHKINFDNLTPIHPTEKLNLGTTDPTTRIIDLIAPIGKGQRALIVAPPRTGKTFVHKSIAHAINQNHPEIYLIALLIDERPEEVTDMERSIKGEVISSNFDEPAYRHVALANIVIERAKRLVEAGKDVVILLDSITRLARAYNAVEPSSGKILSGGVDANALQKPKRFFGAARNIENGGSLTIIGTALVETGSKMDEVIFEEFKGTGNSELILDRNIANRRLFPAIDILKSGTRKEEDMLSKDELQQLWMLRKLVVQMTGTAGTGSTAAIEFLLKKLKTTKDNKEFFETMNS